MSSELTMKNWQLWRQDDNGNQFLVGDYPSKNLAERRLTELMRGHHKQIYWINEPAVSSEALSHHGPPVRVEPALPGNQAQVRNTASTLYYLAGL